MDLIPANVFWFGNKMLSTKIIISSILHLEAREEKKCKENNSPGSNSWLAGRLAGAGLNF